MVYKIKLSQYTGSERLLLSDELNAIIEEMTVLGYRERTMFDYKYHLTKLMAVSRIQYVDELNREVFLAYLKSGEVSQSTRRIRLKAIRAILNRLYDNGVLKDKFWAGIQVKVDEQVKPGVTLRELNKLLESLDLTEFAPFRDACLYILLWETGVRIETATLLELDMIDSQQLIIHFPGRTMKNGRALSLPVTQQLVDMLYQLDELNKHVLQVDSPWLFLTEQRNRLTNNAFGKRVALYKHAFNLKNINPHAIRRGFAKRLLEKGVSVPVISKALNHSDLSVTTKYLNIGEDELIDSIRQSWND